MSQWHQVRIFKLILNILSESKRKASDDYVFHIFSIIDMMYNCYLLSVGGRVHGT